MKALSIRQPFANFILERKKLFEIRSRETNYRGDILICSSLKPHEGFFIQNWKSLVNCKEYCRQNKDIILYGYVLCVAKLIDCRPMKNTIDDEKISMVEFQPNHYIWDLDDIRPVKPFKVKGQLGLFNINDDLITYK